MGLFDTFEIDGKCINCQSILSNWQTKSIGQNMEYFKKGEKMILFGLSISEGNVDVYAYCKNDGCKQFTYAVVFIENGVV
ncbi:MAG: hypothetical protein GPJ54_07945, partial [Candidatus Heimdallarchaeota archaeon]|nr:hypothetical protein [Candidatus Heimdallarchaeota archaeon]